jgi:DNA-binding FadR family transcriptional regulator
MAIPEEPKRRLRVRTMPQLVSDDLRRQIVEGGLKPGDPLPPERELMESFGISRPTLREAMRILEAESLIQTQRGSKGGAVVRTPDPLVVVRQASVLLQLAGATVGDVYLVRSVIEPAAVRLLAEKQGADDAALLRRLAEQAAGLVDNALAFADVAGIFHRTLVERSGSMTLALVARMLSTLTDASYQLSIQSLSTSNLGFDLRRVLRSWARLVDLVEAGEAVDAETHWQRHWAQALLSTREVAGRAVSVPARVIPGSGEVY